MALACALALVPFAGAAASAGHPSTDDGSRHPGERRNPAPWDRQQAGKSKLAELERWRAPGASTDFPPMGDNMA